MRDEKLIFERLGFGKKAREIHRTLATDTNVDGVALRVFLYLTCRLEFDRFTLVPQLEIAEALGRRKAHISRAIRTLQEKGVIVEGDKVGRSSKWRLNREYGGEPSEGE